MVASHALFGVLALLTGGWVLVSPKGTRPHRSVGLAYVAAMVGLCAGSFGIGEEGPLLGFGVFHAMAVASLATVLAGAVPALLRPRPKGWLDAHFNFMAWSYAGLVMALGSHLAGPVSARLGVLLGDPGLAGVAALLLLWGLPPALCRHLLKRREALYRARFAPGAGSGA